MSIEDQQLYWIQFPSKVESGEWNCLDGTTGRIQSLLQKITAKYPQRQYESVEKRSYRGKIE